MYINRPRRETWGGRRKRIQKRKQSKKRTVNPFRKTAQQVFLNWNLIQATSSEVLAARTEKGRSVYTNINNCRKQLRSLGLRKQRRDGNTRLQNLEGWPSRVGVWSFWENLLELMFRPRVCQVPGTLSKGHRPQMIRRICPRV